MYDWVHPEDGQGRIILDCRDDRKLAVPDSGYIALGPTYTEASDVVYVPPYVFMPFVFRKQDGNFVLVGGSGVQEIMHGEALEHPGMTSLEDLVLE
jgi:hypothetical protein